MKPPLRPRQPTRWHTGADALHGVNTMAQHFLTPILALSYAAYDRRRSMEMERRGLPVWEARREAEVQIVHGLAGLDVDGGDVAAILRAIYEIDRAARRGIHLGANRALDIAFAATREDDLASTSSVGHEPATIYRRGEDGERVEQVLGRAYSARTPIMRRACPHGAYQPGWSRERVLNTAGRAGRVLP